MPRADGPFEVLQKANDNAYKIDLPREYGFSYPFNVPDFKPYFEDDHLENLRANSFQQGEDDAPMKDLDEDHVQELPKPKEAQEILQVIRNHIEGQESHSPGLPA